MSSRRPKGYLILAIAVAACLGTALPGDAQFTSFSDRFRAILEGNWQSCRESDGLYAERIYDAKWPGLAPFELHLGPFHEFALFRGIQDDHRDHSSPENLLSPYIVEPKFNRAGGSWDVAGVHLKVALSGGSRDECESWYVRMLPLSTSSH